MNLIVSIPELTDEDIKSEFDKYEDLKGFILNNNSLDSDECLIINLLLEIKNRYFKLLSNQ